MSRRPKGDDGALAVEFSLIFPLFVFLLIWVVYGGFYAYYRITAEHAAQQAVRHLVFTGGFTYPDGTALTFPADQTELASVLKESNPGFNADPSDLTISYSCADPADSPCTDPKSGDLVTITATYPTPVLDDLKWFFLGAANSVKVTVTASGRVE